MSAKKSVSLSQVEREGPEGIVYITCKMKKAAQPTIEASSMIVPETQCSSAELLAASWWLPL